MEPEDFWLFGRIIDRLGDRDTARDCWLEGLRLDPEHAELMREIVLDRLDTGKPIQAARFARRLAARPGWQARGDILLGTALAADDDLRGAAESWIRALAIDPLTAREDAGLYNALARAWLRIGEPSRAREVLRASGISTDDPEAGWLLGRSFLQEQSSVEAEGMLAASRRYRDAHPLEPEPAPMWARRDAASATSRTRTWSRGSRHSRTFQRSPEIQIRSLPDHPIADPGARPSGTRSVARGMNSTSRHGKATGSPPPWWPMRSVREIAA